MNSSTGGNQGRRPSDGGSRFSNLENTAASRVIQNAQQALLLHAAGHAIRPQTPVENDRYVIFI